MRRHRRDALSDELLSGYPRVSGLPIQRMVSVAGREHGSVGREKRQGPGCGRRHLAWPLPFKAPPRSASSSTRIARCSIGVSYRLRPWDWDTEIMTGTSEMAAARCQTLRSRRGVGDERCRARRNRAPLRVWSAGVRDHRGALSVIGELPTDGTHRWLSARDRLWHGRIAGCCFASSGTSSHWPGSHFARAVAACYVSQPALSEAIRKQEQEQEPKV